jgi:hypothetical protein
MMVAIPALREGPMDGQVGCSSGDAAWVTVAIAGNCADTLGGDPFDE